MNKKNAVIYARYSSHGQTEQSIEGQLRDAYDFAEREGYNIVSEYVDRAITGRSDNRADFQRMIQDSSRRNFEFVLVWKLDRFSRNRYDSAIYKARLKKNGVKVISVKENLTDSPEGIILEGMLESMAEYYSANLSVNVKRGLRETLLKGKYVGGRVPFGYKVDNGKLVPHETNAMIVRTMFEQYADGIPKKEIFAYLTEKGVKSPEGHAISMTSFHNIFSAPVYIGKYTYDGQVYENTATPIISQELFDRCQIRIARSKRAPASFKATEEYLLQGKAFCGHCGKPMHGESGRSRNGTKHYYYACSGKKKAKTCAKHNEKKHAAEQYVVQHTLAFVLSQKNMANIAHMVAQKAKQEFSETKIPEMQRALLKIESDLNKLTDALIEAPKSTHKRIYERMELLEAQRTDIEADIAKQSAAAKYQYTEEEILDWLRKFCVGDINDPAYCRKIIDLFVNSVYFYDDRIIIFYNIRPNAPKNPLNNEPSQCSDLTTYAAPINVKSEPPMIFIEGVFGFVFYRQT